MADRYFKNRRDAKIHWRPYIKLPFDRSIIYLAFIMDIIYYTKITTQRDDYFIHWKLKKLDCFDFYVMLKEMWWGITEYIRNRYSSQIIFSSLYLSRTIVKIVMKNHILQEMSLAQHSESRPNKVNKKFD